jgi:RNA-binding protein
MAEWGMSMSIRTGVRRSVVVADQQGMRGFRAGAPAASLVRRTATSDRRRYTIALTSKQRAQLKALAHPLKALIHIGKEGITGTLLANVEEAFNTRELLKIKVLEAALQSAKEVGEDLAWRLEGVELVQVIGRTIVLYRRHPSKPAIQLPG